MNSEPTIAVVGATGLVGQEMLAVIEQLKTPFSEVRALASSNSAGSELELGSDQIEVQELREDSFDGIDIALFATSAELSAKYVPLATKAGAIAIDNSSYFRMHDGIPLIVPEVNAHILKRSDTVIANPNCSTIQLTLVLDQIRKLSALKRVVVSTYQSVSGAGQAAMDELWNQSLNIFNQREIEIENFSDQIAFNCIPQIDTILENGYTKEEFKIINESRKILGLPNLNITSTSVRVPVFHSHAESVNVETESEIIIPDLIKALEGAKGIEVFAEHDRYPMQIHAAGGDSVQVGRIRKDVSLNFGLDLWIVADNLRKGAALNAVQIANHLIEKFAD